MKTYLITLVSYTSGPIKSWKQLGFSMSEVYWNVREEYPVDQYPQIKYIKVEEVVHLQTT